MPEAAKRKAIYEDLFGIPENTIGEIMGGELFVTPRPAPRHSNVASLLGFSIGSHYYLGGGGEPGGWIILFEPEIKFSEEDLLVPDFAGWRKERFPGWPRTNWFSVAPDWVCEVLSPSTARSDRIEKMSIYARYQVEYLWLIDPDPRYKTLEVFKLKSGEWSRIGGFAGEENVRAEPFVEVEIELARFWVEDNPEPD